MPESGIGSIQLCGSLGDGDCFSYVAELQGKIDSHCTQGINYHLLLDQGLKPGEGNQHFVLSGWQRVDDIQTRLISLFGRLDPGGDVLGDHCSPWNYGAAWVGYCPLNGSAAADLRHDIGCCAQRINPNYEQSQNFTHGFRVHFYLLRV